MRPERILLAAGLVLAAGCYSYVPTRVGSLEPGQVVRVRLSPEEADRLEPMRRSDARLMEATVVEASDGEITVNTAVSRIDRMSGTRALFQTLDVLANGIVEVELRERDNVKTGAAIGALALVVAIGLESAFGGDGEGDRDPLPPGPDEGWVPLMLRFPVPF